MPAVIHHRGINYFSLYFDELQQISIMDLDDSYTVQPYIWISCNTLQFWSFWWRATFILPPLRPKLVTDTALWLLMLHFYRHLLNILVKHECGQNLPLYYVSTYTLGNNNGSKKWKAVLRTHLKDPCRKKTGNVYNVVLEISKEKSMQVGTFISHKVKKDDRLSRIRILKKEFLSK